jgi:hypothetical protein
MTLMKNRDQRLLIEGIGLEMKENDAEDQQMKKMIWKMKCDEMVKIEVLKKKMKDL